MLVFSTNCIFCYRERTSRITQVDTCSEDSEKGNLSQFMKLVERFLESSIKLDKMNDADGQVEFGACEDCHFMVDSFCNLYNECKYLEVKMEWELRKLCDVINAADKLRSKRVNINDNANEKGYPDIFKGVRLDLKRKFIQRLSKSYPKVVIQPLNALTKTENSDCGNVQAPLDTCANFPKELFLGWIVTYSAVTLLGLHEFNQDIQSFQPQSSNISDSVCNEDDNKIEGFYKAKTSELSFRSSLEAECEILTETTQQSVMDCKLDTESSSFKTPSTSQPTSTFRKRKGFQETSSTKKSRKRRITKPAGAFRCFCCSKNFTSFLQLRSHRWAYTHILKKRKMTAHFKSKKNRGKKTKTKLTNQDGTGSNANVAFLRPLQKLKQICKENGENSSSEEERYQSDNDKDWKSSSSSSDDDISSTSSSSSICRDEDSFRCQFCDKKFAYLKRHEWRCRLNPACVSKSPKAKSSSRKISSSQETLSLDDEVKNEKTLHGRFSCSLCEVVLKYAPDLALHESEHMKKVERVVKRKANKKLVRYCARCNYSSGERHSYIKHYLKIHLKLSCLRPTRVQTRTSTPNVVKPVARSARRVCDVSEECRKMFESELDLENHRRLHGEFPCTFCPVVESYAPNLAGHELSHCSLQREGVYNCSRCPSILKGRNKYVTHFLETHLNLPSERVSCQNCGAKFYNYQALETHTTGAHNIEKLREEEILKCDQCPAYFIKRISLVKHKKKLHGEDNSNCLDCGKKFASAFGMRVHRRLVHKKKEADFVHVCEVPGCERRFERMSELVYHTQWVHEGKGKDKSLICHECGKKLLNKSALAAHLRLHQTDKVIKKRNFYVCEECGKFFKAQAHLDVHKLSHTGPASWKYCCLFCDKKSATERLLMDHLRTHTKEKPYICEYCGEEYAHGHNLRNHKNKKHDANDRPLVRVIVNGQASRKGQKLPRLSNI